MTASATTRAVPVHAGTTYHLTRRCAGRLRRLRPDADTNAIVRYALFYAAAKHKIRVHGVCFSTNHFHLVVTDTAGTLPDFMQLMNSLIARALNARDRRGESFWGSGSYTRVELSTPEDVLRTLAYVTINPTKDGLVSTPKRWPGFLTLPSQVGTTLRTTRPPSAFFGGNTRGDDPLARPEVSSLPPIASMEVALPLQHFLSLHDYKQRYQAAVDDALAKVYADRKGRGFMGRRSVLAINPLTSAGPVVPTFSRPSPVSKARQNELTLWREAYVLARERWGDPKLHATALFPPGSWLLPQRYDAPVANRSA